MVTLKALALAAALTGAAGPSGGDTVLLDFNAPWCGPCRTMRPVVQRLQAEGYTVREVNIDENKELAARFRVTSIPCFVMIVGGREVDRTVGATSYERLHQMLQSAQARTTPARAPAAAPNRPTPNRGLPTPPPARRPLAVMPVSASQAPAQPAGVPVQGAETTLLQSAVRIRVEDQTGRSYGTGTLIDVRGDQALVLTCGHLFRESQDDGKIFVELFLPSGIKTVPGHLVSYDLNRDVGLLSLRPGMPVRVARVAPKDHSIASGDRVVNIGCNNGQPPTIRQTHVTAIDRYDGPPNIEAAGTPVEGRSGGGLFDQHGHVIGVCFAADASDNEGLYAGLASIHAELDRLGLASVYAIDSAAPRNIATAVAGTPPPLPKRMPNASITETQAIEPAGQAPGRLPIAVPVADHSGRPLPNSDRRLSTAEQAALAEIGRQSRDAEVICIVRPKDPNAKSKIFVVQHASPEFIERLTDAGPARATARPNPRLTSMSTAPNNHSRASLTVHRANGSPGGWRPKSR